jgi:hypothetical protein
MIVAGQLLAIGNDLILRQSDPPDTILLVVLIVLSVMLLFRIRWARWITAVLVAAGGLLELAGVGLLIATMIAPGFWSAVDSAMPSLVSLHEMVVAFAAAQAMPLLAGSVLISAVLDLAAAGTLMFAPSVRSYFAPDAVTATVPGARQ